MCGPGGPLLRSVHTFRLGRVVHAQVVNWVVKDSQQANPTILYHDTLQV